MTHKSLKITKKRLAIWLASPLVVIALALVLVGGLSASMILYSAEVEKRAQAEVASEIEEVEDSSLKPVDIEGGVRDSSDEFGGYILDNVETEDMLVVVDKHVNTKNNGYAMTQEQVVKSETKEAIEGLLRSRGLSNFTVSGRPGNYKANIKHAIDISRVACDDIPTRSDIFKKRDLATYYLIQTMPESLRSGSIEFTIKGDNFTPKQVFYFDPGTSWVRWNEDGGSYMECSSFLQDE